MGRKLEVKSVIKIHEQLYNEEDGISVKNCKSKKCTKPLGKPLRFE